MLSIQLKGLTTLGSGTDELLSDSIYGYSRRLYHDY
jgi:LPS-assembly protein